MRIDRDECVLCGVCVDECSYGALEMFEDHLSVNDKCTLCGACVDICPVEALSLEEGVSVPKQEGEGVWVFGELMGGKLHPVVLELAGEGRKLADRLSQRLSVVILGHGLAPVVGQLSRYPIDDIICFGDSALAHYDAEIYTGILKEAVKRHRPGVILGGATSVGRALLPRLAVELRTGLTADCTGLSIDAATGDLMQTRPAFGGNVYATIECTSCRPQMATVRPRVMAALEPLGSNYGDQEVHWERVDLRGVQSRVRLIDSVEERAKGIELAEAA